MKHKETGENKENRLIMGMWVLEGIRNTPKKINKKSKTVKIKRQGKEQRNKSLNFQAGHDNEDNVQL